jgi:hypothetical protein
VAGDEGWGLITSTVDAAEMHPAELVTVKVYEPEGMPVIVVPVPVPEVVTFPGVRVSVHTPDAGSPLKTTLPVASEQFVWVTDPITGAEGVANMVTISEAFAGPHPPDAGTV